MKREMIKLGWLPAVVALLAAGAVDIVGVETRAGVASENLEKGGTGAVTTGNNGMDLARDYLATDSSQLKDQAWLGAAVEEAPAVLSAQLGLEAGVGLVVSYVATNSPAAKAGLRENDVLVELNGQSLELPAQFRKLIQVRKVGDSVDLAFYRGGKKQKVSAALGAAPSGLRSLLGERGADDYGEAQRQFRDLSETIRDQARTKFDQQKVQETFRRSFEEAQRAYEEAVRYYEEAVRFATNAKIGIEPLRRQLDELTRSKRSVDGGATVTVRNTGPSARSLVQTDESGTIVIFANRLNDTNSLYLTAHDRAGKLLFDGEISTPAERAKVPGDLRDKVESLLKKMESPAGGGTGGGGSSGGSK